MRRSWGRPHGFFFSPRRRHGLVVVKVLPLGIFVDPLSLGAWYQTSTWLGMPKSALTLLNKRSKALHFIVRIGFPKALFVCVGLVGRNDSEPNCFYNLYKLWLAGIIPVAIRCKRTGPKGILEKLMDFFFHNWRVLDSWMVVSTHATSFL
jgi:hypothetical protein